MVVSCVCVCCVCVCLQKKRTKEVDLGIRGKGRKDCCLCVGAKLFLGLQRYRCWLGVCASEIKRTRTKMLRNVTQHAPHSAPRQSTIKTVTSRKYFGDGKILGFVNVFGSRGVVRGWTSPRIVKLVCREYPGRRAPFSRQRTNILRQIARNIFCAK